MDGILSLKWNNHLTVLSNTLSSLHKKDLYSDVTIACNGRFFPVHKLVLSACSDFFEELFKQTPCSHPVVVLKDLLVGDLEALLSYMYLGEANVAQSDLSRLIKAAEYLCIKGLAVPDEGGTTSTSKSTTKSTSKRPHPPQTDDTPSAKRRKSEVNAVTLSNPPSSASSSSISSVDAEGKSQASSTRPPHASPGEGGDSSRGTATEEPTTLDIAEVLIEEHPIVKEEVTEPKCDSDVEEIIARNKRNKGGGQEEEEKEEEEENPIIVASRTLNFTSLNSDGGDDGDDGGGSSGVGLSIYAHLGSAPGPTHPNSGVLQDLIVPGLPGPSVATEMGGWDSMGGFPLEALHSEDSRSSYTLEYLGPGGCGGGGAGSSVVEEAAAAAAVTLSCPYCQRTFTYRSDLNRHIRSHTGEKPYTCRHCDYRATQKSHLNEHIKRKHPHLS